MKVTRWFLIGAVLFASTALAVMAAQQPNAPRSITEVSTTTFDEGNYGPQSVEALAGNITALTISAIGQTKAWQGYYGNITATITLDDGNNNTFYNWSSAEPRGQIYATLNSSMSWLSVGCFDFGGGTMDWDVIESYYNIANDDVDGVNETYTTTGHPDFDVAQRTMSGCPTSYVFQSDAAQSANFPNVLLHDNTNNATGWIYTTLIENKTAGSTNDLLCFNGEPCDFQILVNEDGHGTDVSTTTYYFWVELA